ncbi:hypothetical protein DPMN_045981 [Dreissena polymorpha]|uniref:C2H2-type domain-containing protein n=1 Tax=Dreissena polymorpha TaxID=45954 RepID=A0A9D4I042_DREPO|nr:hypothetical protein DPMN_045981 [Dreissena polymorpha]
MAQCSECGKLLKTRAGLLRHIRRYANSGNYYCCGKAFQKASKNEGPHDVCTVRQELFGQVPTYPWLERKVQKRGIVELLPVWVGS